MEHGTVVGVIEAILNVWQKYSTELFKEQQTIDGDVRWILHKRDHHARRGRRSNSTSKRMKITKTGHQISILILLKIPIKRV